MKPSHTLLVLTIALTAVASAHAGDWTGTLDLRGPGGPNVTPAGDLAADGPYFWFGYNQPIDATTGALLNPLSVPERRTVMDGGLRQRNSANHLVWTRSAGVATDQQMAADAQANTWGRDTQGRLVRVARDGAQPKFWTTASLGFQGRTIANRGIAARSDGDGAWVLFETSGGGDDFVVRLDTLGRVQRQWSVPPCANALYAHRSGGVMVGCGDASNVQLQRFDDTGQAQWASTHAFRPGIDRLSSASDGAVLIEKRNGDDSTWTYVAANGSTVLNNLPAKFGSAHAGGVWLWDGANARHYDSTGAQSGTNAQATVERMIAHDNGNLLIDGFRRSYVVLAPDGSTIASSDHHGYEFGGGESRVAYAENAMTMVIDQPQTHLQFSALVDRDGHALAAPFQSIEAGAMFREARNDDQAYCTSFIKDTGAGASAPVHRVRCYDRASGAPLGMDYSFQRTVRMIDGGSIVRMLTDDGGLLYVHAANGLQLAELNFYGSFDSSHDREFGSIVARTDGTNVNVKRYGRDGSLQYSVDRPGRDPGRVLLGADGHALVMRTQAGLRHLDHLAPDGSLVATREMNLVPDDYILRDAKVSTTSAHLLFQKVALDDTADNVLVVLSSDLGTTRAMHPLVRSAQSHNAALWYDDLGDVYATVLGKAGLAYYHLRGNDGLLLSKTALPVRSMSTHSRAGLGYHVDGDGTLVFDDQPGNSEYAASTLRRYHESQRPGSGDLDWVDERVSGVWSAPVATGQGVLVTVDATQRRAMAAWFTYADEGDNDPSRQLWFTAVGETFNDQKRALLPLYGNAGGRFDIAGNVPATQIGNVELVINGCNSMEFWYSIGDERGVLPLSRLGAHDCAAAPSLPVGPPIRGLWFDTSRGGQGLSLETGPGGSSPLFGGWFTFDSGTPDDSTAQHWFTLLGPAPTQYGQAVTTTLYRTIGGSREGAPTRNSNRVGTATLTLIDCNHATLQYRFDATAVAGAHAELERLMPLTRLGTCPGDD